MNIKSIVLALACFTALVLSGCASRTSASSTTETQTESGTMWVTRY